MKRTLIGILCVVATSAPAWAAPVITAGTLYMLPGTEREVAITVATTGSEQVAIAELFVQVGDGGLSNGGTDMGPVITSMRFVDPALLFKPAAVDKTVTPAPLHDDFRNIDVPLIWRAGALLKVGQEVVPNGTLAIIKLNSAGTTPGTRALKLTDVVAGYDPDGPLGPEVPVPSDTYLAGGLEGEPLAATVVDGTVNVWIRHGLTWIATSDGNWNNATNWQNGSGLPAHYPNVTTDAVLGTEGLDCPPERGNDD